MVFQIFPREEKFFLYFRSIAVLLVDAMKEFKDLLQHPEQMEDRCKKIQDLESKADDICRKVIGLLHTTFITPLDREEIYHLINTMDDIMDFIDSASSKMSLFNLNWAPKYALEFVNLCEKGCENIFFIVDKLENVADKLLNKALSDLFNNEADIKKLLKEKEIYDILEAITNRFEEVSNIVEGIVLEHN